MNRRFIFSLICILLLSACSTTQPTETVATLPMATEAPTEIPFAKIAEGKVIFSKPDGRKFAGTVYGIGETAIILESMVVHGGVTQWDKFVKAVDKEKFTTIAYSHLGTDDKSVAEETQIVFETLKANGYEKIICIGAGEGVKPCGSMDDMPEIIGMVYIAGGNSHHDTSSVPLTMTQINGKYPKFFIAGESDPSAVITDELYRHASEPKSLMLVNEEALHGTNMFSSTNHGEEFLQYLLDFINELP